jgi:hypothetical protein
MSLDIHPLVLSGVYSKAHIHSWCLPKQAGEKAADSTTQHLQEERAHSAFSFPQIAEVAKSKSSHDFHTSKKCQQEA